MANVPGGNLLKKALGVIAAQNFSYVQFLSRNVNVTGDEVATYADPVPARGSVQPVPRSVIQNLGLSFQKNYFNFFLPNSVIDITRDVSGDQFIYQGRTFQCLSKTEWYLADGWDQVLTAEILPSA